MKFINQIQRSEARGRPLVDSRQLTVDNNSGCQIPDARYRIIGKCRMGNAESTVISRPFLLAIAIIFIAFTQNTLQAQTHVISHLNEKLPASGNIIYCSSFEHAWMELSDNVLKDEVRLQKPISLQGNLNHSCKTAAYSPSYISDSRITENGDSIICTSFFQESLQWPVEFQSFGHPMRFYTGADEFTRCEYFGIHLGDEEDLLKYNPQVKVVDFISEDEFVVKLHARLTTHDSQFTTHDSRLTTHEWGRKDLSVKFKATRTEYGWVEIIIAKVARDKTLLKTIESVEQRLNTSTTKHINNSTELIPNDILAIPKINLNVSNEYSELLGKHLANPGFEKYFFALAEQNIKFEMDEQGARAGSDAKIVLKKGPSARRMVIDGPFLIYLKEYGAKAPYLAIWIDDPQWLVASD